MGGGSYGGGGYGGGYGGGGYGGGGGGAACKSFPSLLVSSGSVTLPLQMGPAEVAPITAEAAAEAGVSLCHPCEH